MSDIFHRWFQNLRFPLAPRIEQSPIHSVAGHDKNGIRLRPHLGAWELACKGRGCCGNAWVYIPEMADKFEASREVTAEHFGPASVIVNSGYRCVHHNSRVHGHPTSRHLFGEALDLYLPASVPETSIEEWAAMLKTVWHRVALYEDPESGGFRRFVHVDLGLLEVFEPEIRYWTWKGTS